MRYLPIEKLNIDGHVLEKSICSERQKLIYPKGTIISEKLISAIEGEYYGLYVASNDNDVDTINYPLRKKSIKLLNMITGYNLLESTEEELFLCIEKVKEVAKEIVCDCELKGYIPINVLLKELEGSYHIKHQIDTAYAAVKIAMWFGFQKENLIELALGALLSDLGKAFIPKAILNKRGGLTDNEAEIIKKHPEFSYRVIMRFSNLGEYVANITKNHHERIDGSGYPFGKKNINISSQIVGFADAYTAMIEERAYAPAYSPRDAIKLLEEKRAFCGDIINCAADLTMNYSLGAYVRLVTGEYARILKESLSGTIVIYVYTDKHGNAEIPYLREIKEADIKESIINIRK